MTELLIGTVVLLALGIMAFSALMTPMYTGPYAIRPRDGVTWDHHVLKLLWRLGCALWVMLILCVLVIGAFLIGYSVTGILSVF